MPLHVVNDREVYNEDDSPLPANTPSTGSIYANNRVAESGNRVLELMEKHKKEVQYASRMNAYENGFRAMLEKNNKTLESNSNRRRHETNQDESLGMPATSRENDSRIVQLYKDATDQDRRGSANSHMVKVVSFAKQPGNKDSSKPSPQTVASDEYFNPPSTNEGFVGANGVMVNSSPRHNNYNSEPVFQYGNVPVSSFAIPMGQSALSQTKPQTTNEGFMYEPHEDSEKEDGKRKKDGSNHNNNSTAPAFVTPVQLQPSAAIPLQGRYMKVDDEFDIEANTHTSKSALIPKPEKSHANPSTTASKHKSSTKHKAVKIRSSTDSMQVRGSSSEEDSPSDHEINASRSTAAAPSTWENFKTIVENNFWLILIILAILCLVIGLFVTKGGQEGKYDETSDYYNANNRHFAPVM